MKYEFICMLCDEIQQEGAEFKHSCSPDMVLPQFIPTRWMRFKRWFLYLDHTFFLATGGAILVSGIYTHHFNYSLLEGCFHGLGVGFIIGRIIRYGQ